MCVKYHKCLAVDKFKCETITRSSFVNRVCYLEAKQYMIIKLKETYYHHCSVTPEDSDRVFGRAIDGPVLQRKHQIGEREVRTDHSTVAIISFLTL